LPERYDKKETGKTPTQIIKERTILEAKSLLRNTRLAVSEVAYFLLFDDPSDFKDPNSGFL
jgi:AraC family transcriptional activator of pobA